MVGHPTNPGRLLNGLEVILEINYVIVYSLEYIETYI